MKKGSLPLWAGVVLFALAGLGFLWGAWALAADVAGFLDRSVPAAGTILSYRTVTTTSSDGERKSSEYPTLTVPDAAGTPRTFEAGGSLDPDEHPVGDTVDLLVSTSGEFRAELGSPASRWVNPVLLGVFGAAGLGAAFLIWFLLIAEVRVRGDGLVFGGFLAGALVFALVTWAVSGDSLWLVSHGARARGTVVSTSGAPLVEFTAADGKTYRRQTRVGGDNLPAAGTLLPVLYDPVHPGRARVEGHGDLWFATLLAGGFTLLCAATAAGVFFGVILPRRGRPDSGAGVPAWAAPPRNLPAPDRGAPVPAGVRERLGALADRAAALSGADPRVTPLLGTGDILPGNPSSYQEMFDGIVSRCLAVLGLDPAGVKVSHGPGTEAGFRYAPDGTFRLTLEDRLAANPLALTAELVQALAGHKLRTERATEDPDGTLSAAVSVWFGFGLFSCGAAAIADRSGAPGFPGMTPAWRGPFSAPEYAYLLALWVRAAGLGAKAVVRDLDPDLVKPFRQSLAWLGKAG